MTTFFSNHFGELSSLFVAFCWTMASIAFESAGKKVGSLPVNLIRLILAFFLLAVLSLFRGGTIIPLDASFEIWFWLVISGLIGFVFGDIFLFQAYVVIGARISMLIMSLAPPLTAFFGWIILGEKLTIYHLTGMIITVTGIALVVLSRSGQSGFFKVTYPIKGLLFAFGGAIGQGLGLVISKLGMKDYDPFMATQIRVIAGIFGFGLLMSLTGHIRKVHKVISNRPAMLHIFFGAFFGPFLGVSLSLFAIKHTSTGVAATIMAIVPVLIIAPSYFIMKEKITRKEIFGAIIAVLGVSLLFI